MDSRLFFAATQRNKGPIGRVLKDYIPKEGIVLELASGSGEHAVSFQKQFQSLIWQASDPNKQFRRSINSWIKYEGLSKTMPESLDIDVLRTPWNINKNILSRVTSIVCINMLHVSPWICTETLLIESSKILKVNHPLVIYGPFRKQGRHTSSSNEDFDLTLQKTNKSWGLRDIEKIKELAEKYSLSNFLEISLPSNNFALVLTKPNPPNPKTSIP